MPAITLDSPEFKALDLKQQIALLLRQNKELSQDNERLSNRFGLVWPEQPEFFVQVLSDDEVVYQNGVYAKVGALNTSGSKAVLKFNNGQSEELKRCDSPYLYTGKSSGKSYLGNGGAAYEWRCESQENYLPTLTKKGPSFGFDDAAGQRKNLLIEGDNYHALQVLQHTHRNAIDVIYIDPPYNTGNKDFKYNDKFVSDEDGNRHSSWLSFMKRRITIAKTLLSADGYMFISIDENEHSNIKLLMDSIFGEACFLGNLTWIKKSKPINAGAAKYGLQKKVEYVLVYRKSSASKTVFVLKNGESRKYTHDGPLGKCRVVDIIKSDRGVDRRESMRFSILGFTPPDGQRWQIGQSLASELEKENKIVFIAGVPKRLVYPDDEESSAMIPFWSHLDTVETAESGKKTLSELIGSDHEFDTVKDISLIKEIVSKFGKNAVILDFFAGSGTTGHAVWDLNKEDGGDRTFILVTNNESNICEKVTYERLHNCNQPAHGNYGEGLEYLRLVHIAESDIDSNDMAQSFEYIKQVINVRFRSFSVVEETDDWYVTDKIAVLKNYVKYPEFFEKHGKHPAYGLVTKKERQSQSFRAEAAKRVSMDGIHVFNKEYLNDLYRIVRESSV